MKPTGTQVVAELFSCSRDILNDKSAIEQILRDSITQCEGVSLISLNSHCYHPIGITSVAIISESHVAIHTYPEAYHVSLDIFTCSRDSSVSLNIMNYIKEKFSPKTTRIAEISRGNPIEIRGTDWITDDNHFGGFDVRYHVEKELFSTSSPFQNIRIIKNESFGKMLFLDNDMQIAESDAHLYNENMVSPLITKHSSFNEVAILGGGDGGVLYEVLKHNPGKVTLIDIDNVVIEVCKEYLQEVCHDAFDNSKSEIVIDDVFTFLDKNHQFDAIIYDLTMHPEAFIDMDRDCFLVSLFEKIKKNMKTGAIFTAQCCSIHDKEILNVTEDLLKRFFSDVVFTKTYIPSFCTTWVFVSALNI